MLIKIAASASNRFLSAAINHADLGERISKLLSASPNPKTYGKLAKAYSGIAQDVSKAQLPLSETIQKAKRFVHAGHNQWNTQVRPLHAAISKRGTMGLANVPPVTKPMAMTSASSKPLGGNEWHDIVHGGEVQGIQARLRGTNPYPLQASAHLPNGKIETSGMQVTMAGGMPKGITETYAQRAAESKVGTPGILKGRIQGKHLFPNPTVHGEYGVPHSYLQHIVPQEITPLPIAY